MSFLFLIIFTRILLSIPSFLNRYDNLNNNETLWIVKPPNMNNGTNVRVISNSVLNIPNYPTCVQKYVKHPLLINGFKVSKLCIDYKTTYLPIDYLLNKFEYTGIF